MSLIDSSDYTFLSEFLEHLTNRGFEVGTWAGNKLVPSGYSQDELIAEFLRIDLVKLRREKAAQEPLYRVSNRLV